MKTEDKATCVEALIRFGIDHQEEKLMEEMSELTQAIIKHRHNPDDADIEHNLCEEIVDVYIVLNQLMCVYGFDKRIFEQKMTRLKRLIADE